MGGSSHSYVQDAEIARLAEIARRELSASQGSPHVFISFATEDLDEVNLLRGQAKSDSTDLEFDDWSVKVPYDSERAEYIRFKIRERIRRSSATLVLLSADSATSRWVQWEIEESLRQGKRVAGVYSGSTPPSALPQAFREDGLTVMRWNHTAISEFLNGD